jgi:hypothetical protein
MKIAKKLCQQAAEILSHEDWYIARFGWNTPFAAGWCTCRSASFSSPFPPKTQKKTSISSLTFALYRWVYTEVLWSFPIYIDVFAGNKNLLIIWAIPISDNFLCFTSHPHFFSVESHFSSLVCKIGNSP